MEFSNNLLTFFDPATSEDIFELRPGYQRGFLKSSKFGTSNATDYNLTVDQSKSDAGYIKVNTIDIVPTTPGVKENPYPWTGIYFSSLPVKLKANAKKGYKFLHWLKNNSFYSDSEEIEIILSSNTTYKAVFEEYILSDNPFPVALNPGACGYTFKAWPDTSPKETYPPHMAFVYVNKPNSVIDDTGLDAEIGGLWTAAYKSVSKSVVIGNNEDGVSFLNKSGIENLTDSQVGGAILALNTEGQDSVFVSFTAGTVLKNKRTYALRLRYRIGDISDFKDLLDKNNQIIEYVRESDDSERRFEKIALPAETLNQPYIQLFWQYYWTGEGSGSRPELRLDDIKITTKANYPKMVTHSGFTAEYSVIESEASIKKPGETGYKVSEYILLNPGFEVERGAVFKAEVKNCND